MDIARVTAAVRDIPDFPKPGIIFKDITPLLADPEAFGEYIDSLAAKYADGPPDVIVGIESRGFIFGTPLAYKLKKGFVPIRKKGKLPYETCSESYELEYGSAEMEIHRDAFKPGSRVLIVDDLLATGGTAAAAARLIEKIGGVIIGVEFLIELAFLSGRDNLRGYPVHSVLVVD